MDAEPTVWLEIATRSSGEDWRPIRDPCSRRQRRAIYRLLGSSHETVKALTPDEASQVIELLARARGRLERNQ